MLSSILNTSSTICMSHGHYQTDTSVTREPDRLIFISQSTGSYNTTILYKQKEDVSKDAFFLFITETIINP